MGGMFTNSECSEAIGNNDNNYFRRDLTMRGEANW